MKESEPCMWQISCWNRNCIKMADGGIEKLHIKNSPKKFPKTQEISLQIPQRTCKINISAYSAKSRRPRTKQNQGKERTA